MSRTIRPGHAFAGRAGPVDVLSAGNKTGFIPNPLALQQRLDLDAAAIRAAVHHRIAREYRISAAHAAVVAELLFDHGRRA